MRPKFIEISIFFEKFESASVIFTKTISFGWKLKTKTFGKDLGFPPTIKYSEPTSQVFFCHRESLMSTLKVSGL